MPFQLLLGVQRFGLRWRCFHRLYGRDGLVDHRSHLISEVRSHRRLEVCEFSVHGVADQQIKVRRVATLSRLGQSLARRGFSRLALGPFFLGALALGLLRRLAFKSIFLGLLFTQAVALGLSFQFAFRGLAGRRLALSARVALRCQSLLRALALGGHRGLGPLSFGRQGLLERLLRRRRRFGREPLRLQALRALVAQFRLHRRTSLLQRPEGVDHEVQRAAHHRRHGARVELPDAHELLLPRGLHLRVELRLEARGHGAGHVTCARRPAELLLAAPCCRVRAASAAAGAACARACYGPWVSELPRTAGLLMGCSRRLAGPFF